MVGSVDVVQSSGPLDHPIFNAHGFFLWGVMKDPVYNSEPHKLDDLKMAISTQFNALNSNRSYAPESVNSLFPV